MFVEISPTDFCEFDLIDTPTKLSIAKKARIWTYFKFVHFFAFEAKLLEIEAEDANRVLHYAQVYSFQKRFVKEKIKIICWTFSEIEISQLYPLSRERYESVNKYNVLIRAS